MTWSAPKMTYWIKSYLSPFDLMVLIEINELLTQNNISCSYYELLLFSLSQEAD